MRILRHNIAMLAVLILTMVGLGLAGCMSDRVPATVPHANPQLVDVGPVCGQVKVYTGAEESALADAMEGLDKDSPIIRAMGDYKRMRDEARACAQAAVSK